MSAATSSALHQVARARRQLLVLLIVGALLTGAAVVAAGLVLRTGITAAARQWGGARALLALRPLLGFAAVAAGAVTMGVRLWRSRRATSLLSVALWIEEGLPTLRYALVTLADPAGLGGRNMAQLEMAIGDLDTVLLVRKAAWRVVGRPIVALGMGLLLLALLPRSWTAGQPVSSTPARAPSVSPLGNRLLGLRGRLTPPEYTRWPATSFEDPLTISGLAGSRVVLQGRQSAEGIQGTIGDSALTVRAEGEGWAVEFSLPDSAAALTLTDRSYRRIVVLDPRADEVPTVRLRSPAHDTTVRLVTGSLQLEADLIDDIGLDRAAFEYIVSSGESEGNYTFRSGTLAARSFQGALTGRLALTVPLRQFELKEGDQLSIRAVASDGNTRTGPGRGFSETRIIRVARASEYDSLAVTPAPPAIDTAAMSLRMLIIATEKLERSRATLARAAFIAEARRLARKAEILRDKIKEIMDQQSMGGEFAVDSAYLSIYNDMWDGVRGLSIAEPAQALPPLRSAYATLKKLQDARRYFVRGQTAPPLVDVARVRLTGTDTVEAGTRSPRGPAAGPADRYAARYRAAVALIPLDRPRVIEELTLLQSQALRDAPLLAGALRQALEALREGADPAASLLSARRAIEGRPRTSDSPATWEAW